MRKRYLFLLMLLFPLATMFSSGKAHAADPDKALYDAAIAAITNGAYYITTDVNGEKYFITQEGGLTSEKEYAYLFPVSQVTGGALYDVGFLIDPGNNTHFSNTTLTDNKADLHYGSFRQDGGNNRADWERQVLYMNEEGKVAIRSCNTAFGESSWADAGRAFWTWEIADPEDEFAMPTPAYTYDPAFIWSFELPAPVESIFIVVKALYNDYEVQFYEDVDNPDPENVNMGTEFGQLSDWETWRKFKAILDTNYDLMARMEAEGYDYDSDPDAPTLDEVNATRAAVDSMWQVILNSEVPYKVPQDGYYRILTRMRYYTEDAETLERTYVNKGMLASFDINYPDKAMWGTLRRDRANYVWKLTQHGDSISMYNVGMENYVSFDTSDSRLRLTKDEAKVSHVVFDYAANTKVDIDDFTQADRDIFYIRLASAPRHNGEYVHQLNHGRGKDSHKDQELCFWSETYNMGEIEETDGGTSEWYLEPVSEEEVEQLIKEFAPIRNHDVLVQQNQELRNTIANAIEEAKDPIKTDFITSASQLSSPNSDEAEGTNIGNLIDNDGGTFWHTSWHSSNNDIKMAYEGVDYHYLAISGMEKMVGNCNLYFRQRNGADNDHPAEVAIFGAADPETDDADWTLMATLTIPKVGNGDENNVSFTVTEGYPYLRLIVTKVKKNDGSDMEHRTYWHAAEIHLSTIEENPNSQFIILGEVSTNLVNALEANKAIADEAITLADYEKLLSAYEAFKAAIVDPTELRNALAKYAKVTEGVVEGTEPGQWADTTVPKAYDALYAEAKAYNEAGRYTAEQIHKYAELLKAMSKSVDEQANGVKTGVWYHIMFPTEEMYDAYGFDKSGAGKSDLVVEQEYQWGNFVAAAELIEEEGEADGEGNPTTIKRLETLSKDDISDVTRLFFMNKEEIEDDAVSLFRFVPRAGDDFTATFNNAMENSAMALGMATSYVRGSALITDKAQLSSNASDEAEGTNIGALIDGNKGTFWHRDWHQRVLAPHYLQVAFKDPVSGTIQVDITRRNNDFGHIEHMFIQGSQDGESWTNIGYMAVPYESPNEEVTSPAIDLNGSYNYLRFTLTRRSGLDIEMDPFAVITDKNQYQVDYTYFHAAEFQIYPVKLDKEISDNAKTLQEIYNGASKVVNIYREPTAEQVAVVALAYKAFQDEFNAAEGKAILPNVSDKPAPTYALQNKATGMFINAAGSNSNDTFLKLTPTFFSYKALGYERSLMHGKNINGADCTYLHSGNNTHRLCTWDASTAGSNSGLVIREVEAVEPAEFNFHLSIKVGEIYDFCAPVTITNKDEGVAYTGIGKYTDEDGIEFLALKRTETIEAGQPAFYILEDTTMYEVDADPELVAFSMPAEPEFKLEGDTINGFIACLVNHDLGANDIFFDHCYASCAGKTGFYQPAPCVVVDLGIVREVEPNGEYDFAICLSGEDVVDGIKDVKTAVAKISQPGDVYSVDGKLLKSNATLNSLNSLGKGMYILNGVKVLVK